VVHGTNGQATAISTIPSLGQLSTTTVTNLTATVLNNQVKLSITTNPAGNTANRRYVRYFLSTNAQVSNTNYTYFSAVFTAQINPFEKPSHKPNYFQPVLHLVNKCMSEPTEIRLG